MMCREQMNRNLYDPVVKMTLQTWYDEEEYVSYMPLIPIYPNKETEQFIERFYSEALPYTFSYQTNISRELTAGIHIYSHITIPDFEHNRASTFVERLENFIEAELKLVEHGY